MLPTRRLAESFTCRRVLAAAAVGNSTAIQSFRSDMVLTEVDRKKQKQVSKTQYLEESSSDSESSDSNKTTKEKLQKLQREQGRGYVEEGRSN